MNYIILPFEEFVKKYYPGYDMSYYFFEGEYKAYIDGWNAALDASHEYNGVDVSNLKVY